MNLVYVAQLAYFLTFVSYAARNVNWLRCGAIVAGVASIYYASTVANEPLWIPILWNAAFIAVNGGHLALSRWRSRNVRLDPLEDFLSKTVLMNFPPAEVRSFTSLASEGELSAGAQLIRAGAEMSQLYCIVKGRVHVLVKERKVAELGPGRFVGEMSLLTRSLARADVVVSENMLALVWPHQSIENWVNGDASRLGLLQSALGTQVVEELLRRQGEELTA